MSAGQKTLDIQDNFLSINLSKDRRCDYQMDTTVWLQQVIYWTSFMSRRHPYISSFMVI